MNETDVQAEKNALKPWVAPHLTALDVSLTSTGPSPNVVETALTDASLS